MSASSTVVSRLRYRSMIAVSNVRRSASAFGSALNLISTLRRTILPG
jgi:hypothetical protein